jgi:molecular chaperone DnaJ
VIRVEVPTKLSSDESEMLRRFAEGRGETVGEPSGGLFSKIKSAFS